jgi:hypothetical protein
MTGESDLEDEQDVSVREQIARLEGKIEELADAVERCRKLGLFAHVLVIGGALWLFAGLFGIVYFGPAMLGAITAILGGLVLGGSNRSTMQQSQAALAQAEARRNDLIGAIDLRTINTDLTGTKPIAGPTLH